MVEKTKIDLKRLLPFGVAEKIKGGFQYEHVNGGN
jgi:hypothetical protein